MIRPVAGLGVLCQLAVIALFSYAIYKAVEGIAVPVALFWGLVLNIALKLVARSLLTSQHREGVKLIRISKFAEATPCFLASYKSMVRHPWIDRFRWLLLGENQLSYREMALCNAAFCYSQLGEGRKAIDLYEQALREFPNSSLATASLNMLRSVQQPKPLGE